MTYKNCFKDQEIQQASVQSANVNIIFHYWHPSIEEYNFSSSLYEYKNPFPLNQTMTLILPKQLSTCIRCKVWVMSDRGRENRAGNRSEISQRFITDITKMTKIGYF